VVPSQDRMDGVRSPGCCSPDHRVGPVRLRTAGTARSTGGFPSDPHRPTICMDFQDVDRRSDLVGRCCVCRVMRRRAARASARANHPGRGCCRSSSVTGPFVDRLPAPRVSDFFRIPSASAHHWRRSLLVKPP
jgi:hypothetical protein